MAEARSGYLLIKADEDGNPVRFMDYDEVMEMLEDPVGYASIDTWLTRVPEQRDPNYWQEGTGLLLRYEVTPPRAKETVTRWEIDE